MKNMIMALWLMFTICANAQHLRYMYFLNEDIGWIAEVRDSVGYDPINTYRTTNGGISWINLGIASFMPVFVNDSVGFLNIGNYEYTHTALYKTYDKGETWQFIDSLEGYIRFIDEMNWYAEFKHTDIKKTTDGGTTWTYIGPDYGWSNYEFITKDKFIMLSYLFNGYIVTTNSGISWDSVNFPHYRPNRLRFPIIADSLHWFVVTQTIDYDYPNYSGVYSTTDGGDTWSNTLMPNPGPLSLGDTLSAIMGAFRGGYKITDKGFVTWEEKDAPSPKVIGYYFSGCKMFYACGDSGYFAKSTDCGDTWTQIPFVVLNPTDVNESSSTNTNFSLEQNYPNPFNPVTKINYTVATDGNVSLIVYDIMGKEVKTLIDEYNSMGNYNLLFNASNFPSGIYFYKIQTGNFVETKKMVLLK